jgi:hypothetical protein
MFSTIIIYPYSWTWAFDAAAYAILAATALKLAIIGLILLSLWAFKPEALKIDILPIRLHGGEDVNNSTLRSVAIR